MNDRKKYFILVGRVSYLTTKKKIVSSTIYYYNYFTIRIQNYFLLLTEKKTLFFRVINLYFSLETNNCLPLFLTENIMYYLIKI